MTKMATIIVSDSQRAHLRLNWRRSWRWEDLVAYKGQASQTREPEERTTRPSFFRFSFLETERAWWNVTSSLDLRLLWLLCKRCNISLGRLVSLRQKKRYQVLKTCLGVSLASEWRGKINEYGLKKKAIVDLLPCFAGTCVPLFACTYETWLFPRAHTHTPGEIWNAGLK